jgi:hypothetical protein
MVPITYKQKEEANLDNELYNMPVHKRNLGPFRFKSHGWKSLGPTLSIFRLLFGVKLLINGRTLMFSILVNDRQIEKIFFFFASLDS